MPDISDEEGVVPGGGVALLKVSGRVKKVVEKLSGDEKVGGEIVLKALEMPVRQIAKNSGVDGGVVVNEILKNIEQKAYGYDALKNEYVDMIESGIIDPTKVTRSALQNAASVAATLLTTEAVVAEVEDKTEKQATENY